MLFKKKAAASASGGKSSQRSNIEFIANATGEKGLAFGLQWRSIVTENGRESAMKMARNARATHFVYRVGQAGFGTLKGKASDRPPVLYPAAAVAARQYLGDGLFALSVAEGEYWVAFIRNGAPTSTDRFFSGSNDAEVLAYVREQLDQLESEGLRVVVHTDIESSGLEGAKPMTIDELFDVANREEEALNPLPALSFSIPKPVLIVGCVVILGLVGQKVYGTYKAKKRAELARANVIVDEDPAIAWDRAIEQWRASINGQNPRGLDAVRASISDLPVEWEGWFLKNANCVAGTAAATEPNISWGCSAVFERRQTGTFTRDMKPKVPANWTVTFSPINQMALSWSVQAPRVPLELDKLPKLDFHKVETVSKLQALEPAFSQSPNFNFTAVSIKAPVPPSGKPYPPDPRAEGIQSAPFTVRGPLRTLDAVLAADLDVAWQSLSLSYSPEGVIPSLRTSSLVIEANGVMYAKN